MKEELEKPIEPKVIASDTFFALIFIFFALNIIYSWCSPFLVRQIQTTLLKNEVLEEEAKVFDLNLYPLVKLDKHPSNATIETTIESYGEFKPHWVYDGSERYFFWSSKCLRKGDYLTLRLKKGQAYRELMVITGRSTEILEDGILEISSDGIDFQKVADFKDGIAKASLPMNRIKAIRIKVTAGQYERMRLREIILK